MNESVVDTFRNLSNIDFTLMFNKNSAREKHRLTAGTCIEASCHNEMGLCDNRKHYIMIVLSCNNKYLDILHLLIIIIFHTLLKQP